jgi:hypothetical protein
MMGWMAPLRHLGANAGWSKPISEQGAIAISAEDHWCRSP